MSTLAPQRSALDETEVRLFIEGIRLKYGYDFQDYAEASLIRRVENVLRQLRFRDPIEALKRVLRDPEMFEMVLSSLTVTTSEMFRDPEFFSLLRTHVVPVLRTYPSVNLWSAGCSTGEEVYSLAILLCEEGLAERTTIYATDINPRALKAAKSGIYRAADMKVSTRNYQAAGGSDSFSRYYTADYGLAKMNSSLLENVVFSEHNLVTDGVFAEFQLILCRNVLIYFNRPLQSRVLDLFRRSLAFGGFMGLGSKESLQFTPVAQDFETVNEKWRLYRMARIKADIDA